MSSRRSRKLGQAGLIASTLSSLGAALGAGSGKRSQAKPKTVRKAARRNPSRASGTLQNGLITKASFAPTSAPVTRSVFIRRTVNETGVRLPHVTTMFRVQTDAAGSFKLYTINGILIGETAGIDASDGNIVGSTVSSIMGSFAKFRVVKLGLTYRGLTSTSSSDSVGFAYSPEGGYVDGTTIVTNSNVIQTAGSCYGPTWGTFDIGTAELDSDWKFVRDSASSGAAERRQDHAGTIFIASPVTGALSAFYGYLVMDLDIEVSGMGPPVTVAADVRCPSAPSNSQQLPAALCAASSSPQPRLLVDTSTSDEYELVRKKQLIATFPLPSVR